MIIVFSLPTNATLKWEKTFDYSVQQSNRMLAPDGSLLIWNYDQVTRLDPLTGSEYWTSPLGFSNFKSIRFVPGTLYGELKNNERDFLPDVKLLEKTNKKEKKEKKKFGKFGKLGMKALNKAKKEFEIENSANVEGETKNVVKVSDLELLDLRNGRIVMSAERVIDYRVLKRSGNILVYGFLDNLEKPSIALFDASTSERLWNTSDIFTTKKKGLKIGGFKLNIDYDSDALITEPIDLADGTLLIALKTGIQKLDMKTGKSIWHTKLPKPKKYVPSSTNGRSSGPSYAGTKCLLSPVDDDSFIYIEPGTFRMMKYSIKDGKELWKSFASIKGNVGQIIFTPKGLILAPAAGLGNLLVKAKAYYYGYENGKPLWPQKVVKVKGGIKEYRFIDSKKILLQLENANGKSFINILDIGSGKLVFQKDKKVKGSLYYVEQIKQGLLYMTDKEVNVLNSKGEKIIKKSFAAKNMLAKMHKDKIFLVDINDRELFSFNKKTLEVTPLAKLPKPKFKETYQSLDIFENIIAVSSQRNLARYNFNGKQLSYNFYKKADETKFTKAVLFLAAATTGPVGVFVYGVPAVTSLVGDARTITGSPAYFDRAAQQKANNVREPYFSNDPIYKRLLDRLSKSGQNNRYQSVFVGFQDYSEQAKLTVDNISKHQALKFMNVKENTGIAVVDKKLGEISLLVNAGQEDEKEYISDNIDQFILMNPMIPELRKRIKDKKERRLRAEYTMKAPQTLEVYTW